MSHKRKLGKVVSSASQPIDGEETIHEQVPLEKKHEVFHLKPVENSQGNNRDQGHLFDYAPLSDDDDYLHSNEDGDSSGDDEYEDFDDGDKKGSHKEYEEAYYDFQEEQRKKKDSGSINWKWTSINVLILAICLAGYGAYTYDLVNYRPSDTIKPLFPMMISTERYNTTSRDVTRMEIDTERIIFDGGTVTMAQLSSTLEWYARNMGYNVVCAHHLSHHMGVHPKACVLHNKPKNEIYFMLNPGIIGSSKETEMKVEQSVSCTGRMTNKRFKMISLEWFSYPEKLHMYSKFRGADASTLQLVIEEMNGKLKC